MRKLSILMPTYNSGATIEKSLSNVLKINEDFELLIADGGSIDNTIEIIESFVDSRIKLISRSDSGIYVGINNVISSISGKYVQFLNSNDFINHEYVSRAVEYLDSDANLDFIYGSILKDGVKIEPRNKHWIFDYQYMPFPHISLVIRRDLFLQFMPFNTNYKITADCDFAWKLKDSNAKGLEIREIVAAVVEPGGISDGWIHLKENLVNARTRNKNYFTRSFVYVLQLFKYKLNNL